MSKSVIKASTKLKTMMNQAISFELQVAVQYMYQHIQATGPIGVAINGEFRKIAITEMKHAERIAERLWYLGATPTTLEAPITVGSGLAEFISLDAKAEANTIALYKEIIEAAKAEGDETTALLFREILKDEEEHHDLFIALGG